MKLLLKFGHCKFKPTNQDLIRVSCLQNFGHQYNFQSNVLSLSVKLTLVYNSLGHSSLCYAGQLETKSVCVHYKNTYMLEWVDFQRFFLFLLYYQYLWSIIQSRTMSVCKGSPLQGSFSQVLRRFITIMWEGTTTLL